MENNWPPLIQHNRAVRTPGSLVPPRLADLFATVPFFCWRSCRQAEASPREAAWRQTSGFDRCGLEDSTRQSKHPRAEVVNGRTTPVSRREWRDRRWLCRRSLCQEELCTTHDTGAPGDASGDLGEEDGCITDGPARRPNGRPSVSLCQAGSHMLTRPPRLVVRCGAYIASRLRQVSN